MSIVHGSDAAPGIVSGIDTETGAVPGRSPRRDHPAAACGGPCSRASVLRAAAAIAVGGAGAAALASCSNPDAPTAVAEAPSGGGATATVAASEVPVGGVISTTVGEDPVVVAQPSAGTFVAFSAVCTHAGGIVAPADELVVRCPLHGSEFDLGDDAAVVAPPAQEPLATYPLTMDGDQLVLG